MDDETLSFPQNDPGARSICSQVVARRALKGWQGFAAGMRLKKEKMLAALRLHTEMLLQKVMAVWRRFALLVREKAKRQVSC